MALPPSLPWQFNLKRGTTTNSFLVKGGSGAYEALIDVPSKVFDADIGEHCKLLARRMLLSSVSSLRVRAF